MPDQFDFKDPEWVAEQLNIDKNSVYRYLNEGLLPGMQLGRKWLISESSLVEFLKSEERRQTSERRAAAAATTTPLAFMTERARAVLESARDEALKRQHNYIGTEHQLLAIVADAENAGARALLRLNVDLASVAQAINTIIGNGPEPIEMEIGLTPRAQHVVEFAMMEAGRLTHTWVGCEHLLLGLIAEPGAISSGVLEKFGVTLDAAREQVLAIIKEHKAAKKP